MAKSPKHTTESLSIPVSLWIRRLREESDQQAASQLYERYFQRLVRVLRGRVNHRIRAISDSEDASQYVLAEVLTGLDQGVFPDLQDRDSLWALMIHIGEARLRQDWRHATAQKRDVRTTLRMDAPTFNRDDEPRAYDPEATDPSPELAVELEEIVEHLAGRLRSDTSRKMLVWELQGRTTDDIKRLLEQVDGRPVSARTVRRKRQLVRKELCELLPGATEPTTDLSADVLDR